MAVKLVGKSAKLCKRKIESGNNQQVVLGHITKVLKSEKLDQQKLFI
jgi:hypothetical protein